MFKRSSNVLALALWTFLIGLLCCSLQAQSVTGNLTGTVADPSGAVIPGATVIMKLSLIHI